MVAGFIFYSLLSFAMANNTGLLEQNLNKLINYANDKESCEFKTAPLAKEIVQLLLLHQNEISKLRLPQTNATINKEPTTLVAQERIDSWNDAYSTYKKIKHLSIKDNPVEWINLNSYVRSLLFNDIHRLSEQINFSIDRISAPLILKLSAQLRSCLANSTCINPQFSTDVEHLAKNKKSYSYSWKYFLESLGTDKRLWLSMLDYHVEKDAVDIRFNPNPQVIKTNHGYELPMNAGDFENQKELLAKKIESVWHKVKIRWVALNHEPGVFSFIKGTEAYERAYTRWEDFKIVLSPDSSAKDIAHEVGHALGFQEHYYTVWDESKCHYVFQSNPSDIMSDTSTGTVTLEEWETLEKYYPLPK